MTDRHPPSISSDQPYTACYCEENIYLLAKALESPEISNHWETFVTFISNDTRSVSRLSAFVRFNPSSFCDKVALWGQRAGTAPFPVVWDYHVVLVIRRRQPGVPPTSDSLWVYDFDSVFGMPSPWQGRFISCHGSTAMTQRFFLLENTCRGPFVQTSLIDCLISIEGRDVTVRFAELF